MSFEDVSKRYAGGRAGASPAVANLTFSVPPGSICVIVGPSGCGKTTTLKMVNRLIEPSSGRILLDGVDISTRDPIELRRGIGYVIQQSGLFPHLTVAENVAVVPRLLGASASARTARAEELLVLVGLDPSVYGTRYPSQLSGGERQRIGVARALAADPPVMLMDEPFGAVDPIARTRLQDEFLRLQRDLSKTILFVTHDIDEAIKMGDLVAILETTPGGGRLAQFGVPADILADPASDFVARFVGADRGLKRLSLTRVGAVALETPVTVRQGEAADDVRARLAAAGEGYALVVDGGNRPVGWLTMADLRPGARVSEGDARPSSPAIERESTLKDALSLLLDADVQSGIVVDTGGRLLGILTVGAITERLHAGPSYPGDPNGVAGGAPLRPDDVAAGARSEA